VPSARYEVGENEKHYFTVNLNMGSRRVKIEQDGALVASRFLIAPTAKKFTFDVGTSEPHHVEIIAGLFHAIELKADGRVVQPVL
jgi:hypothetical protein